MRGNLLALKPIDVAAVPQLFVCEKIQLRKCVDKPTSFYLKCGSEETLFTSSSEEDTEKWLIKVTFFTLNHCINVLNIFNICFLVSNMFSSNDSS